MLKYFSYIILIALSLTMADCKVRYTLNDVQIPAEAKTVSVALFANNSTLAPPVLPQKFSERLRDMVSSQTNLALKSSGADLAFEGYISDYTVAPVAIQSGDQAALNRLTITVFVKYTNPFEKAKSFEQSFTRFNDFPADKSLSSEENALIDDINRQLCEDIFNRAFNNW